MRAHRATPVVWPPEVRLESHARVATPMPPGRALFMSEYGAPERPAPRVMPRHMARRLMPACAQRAACVSAPYTRLLKRHCRDSASAALIAMPAFRCHMMTPMPPRQRTQHIRERLLLRRYLRAISRRLPFSMTCYLHFAARAVARFDAHAMESLRRPRSRVAPVYSRRYFRWFFVYDTSGYVD